MVQGADLRLVPKAANLEERGIEGVVSSSRMPLARIDIFSKFISTVSNDYILDYGCTLPVLTPSSKYNAKWLVESQDERRARPESTISAWPACL